MDQIKPLLIDFADWYEKLSPSQRVSVWSKDGQYQGIFNMDNEQLVDKYLQKKEKEKKLILSNETDNRQT